MSEAYLVRIFPKRRSVIAVRSKITPALMQRLLKSREVANADVGVFDGCRILYARAHLDPREDSLRPRWQLGDGKLIAGDAILFGQNSAGRAASCPMEVAEVVTRITWHPPLARLGEAIR